jgi:imidazolonepropionase-like amidohydrolase
VRGGRRRAAASLPMLLLATLAWGCGGGDAGSGAAAAGDFQPEDILVRGGMLFDGTRDTLVRNRGIVIRDGRFAQVDVDLANVDAGDARVIELTDDQTILPGLFDLHAHYALDLFGEGRVDDTVAYPAMFLANGVTSTFSAGEVNPEKMHALRLRIEAGEQMGPRLFNSGPYYGSARAGWSDALTPDSIRKEVDYWVGQGVRNFKAKNPAPDELQALIDAAHAHGATVTGHLGSGFRTSVNPRDAILMGIDRVEHFMGGDAVTADRPAYSSLVEMTPDMPEVKKIVDLYKEHGTFFDATLSAYGYYGRRDPEVYTYYAPEMDYLTPYARAEVEKQLPRRVNEQFERIYWVKRDLLKAFYDQGAGDLITLGTDHPSWGEFFSPFSVHRELHTMVLAGLPPHAALKAATVNASKALKVNGTLGTIEAGKIADLVVIDGDPLADIRTTRNVVTVVRDGRVYDPQELLASAKGRLGPTGPEGRTGW